MNSSSCAILMVTSLFSSGSSTRSTIGSSVVAKPGIRSQSAGSPSIVIVAIGASNERTASSAVVETMLTSIHPWLDDWTWVESSQPSGPKSASQYARASRVDPPAVNCASLLHPRSGAGVIVSKYHTPGSRCQIGLVCVHMPSRLFSAPSTVVVLTGLSIDCPLVVDSCM